MRVAPRVYGAALAASRDEATAADTTERVLRVAAGEPATIDADRLVERAIRLSVRVDPVECFACVAPDDREAVALARLAGYTVREVAAVLGKGTDEIKAMMLRGLRSIQTASPRCAQSR
jgi:DNA-directed RNA polymerase specialized sigma24 family protein